MSKKCPHCQKDNPEENTFCKNCGKLMVAAYDNLGFELAYEQVEYLAKINDKLAFIILVIVISIIVSILRACL